MFINLIVRNEFKDVIISTWKLFINKKQQNCFKMLSVLDPESVAVWCRGVLHLTTLSVSFPFFSHPQFLHQHLYILSHMAGGSLFLWNHLAPNNLKRRIIYYFLVSLCWKGYFCGLQLIHRLIQDFSLF